ncbi:MAG: hypothetical protein WCN98_19345, partial [Verrucomicrobiaceae bacterium]
MRVARNYFIIVFTSTVLACSGCGWMPKVKIPFTGHGAGTSPASDPKLSYTPNQTLAPGHTLKLSVWSGQSSPSKIYDGSVMIND